MATPSPTAPVSRRGDPPWEIAKMFPEQGYWDEYDFFSLPNTRGVEFNDGMIEVLPVPKKTHEFIVRLLLKLLEMYIFAHAPGAVALPPGYKLRIPSRKFRQPDVTFLTAKQAAAGNEDFTISAELVIEVVSEDDPDRDYVVKREEYALAGIPEYWIIDHAKMEILVLRLSSGTYVEQGKFSPGQVATSVRLPEFMVAVDEVMRIGR